MRNQLDPMEVYRLPRPRPALTEAAFACCEMQFPTEAWPIQQAIYLMAFEQAQAIARPSLPERDLAGVWN